MPRVDEAFETNVPKPLQMCRVCTQPAIVSVVMRHGSEWPACIRDAGAVIIAAFIRDGDHGEVEVRHLRWFYDKQDPKEAQDAESV